MSLSTNTTYRVFLEKLGGTDPASFVGDAGELFFDPSIPALKLSDGSTPGGVGIGTSGGGVDWGSVSAGNFIQIGSASNYAGAEIAGGGGWVGVETGSAYIRASDAFTSEWFFSDDGEITFPDSTIQERAFPTPQGPFADEAAAIAGGVQLFEFWYTGIGTVYWRH